MKISSSVKNFLQAKTTSGSRRGHEAPVAGSENFLEPVKGYFFSADGNGQRDDISRHVIKEAARVNFYREELFVEKIFREQIRRKNFAHGIHIGRATRRSEAGEIMRAD